MPGCKLIYFDLQSPIFRSHLTGHLQVRYSFAELFQIQIGKTQIEVNREIQFVCR